MCFCYPKFRWVFLLHLCTLHSSRCLGVGGETVCSVFETSMKPTEPLKHRYFNVGKSKSDQWHRAPWVPVHKVPSTKHRRWKSWKSKVGTFIEGLKFLKVSPSCVKFPKCFANVAQCSSKLEVLVQTTGKTHKGIVRCCCLNMFFLEFKGFDHHEDIIM